ncbi:hypothetical protein CBR_g4012 [Chara braunii]|uniref:Dihydroxyacetone kinase n=1 Tax=Chara braunii TaxID=69332 RepID=A0A388KH58_CHABU|nr:hypothetical protein CBR_g4012 [Chara braunii]|eukprot:GBG69313.1 hypothetical protein CBR_g4012 [Chara braunii]
MAEGPAKLINNTEDVVTEALDGLVHCYPHLVRLDGFPEVKVVLRRDVQQGCFRKVAVISGGGSGHEPAHAGYVGQGMLTAAVCGNIFSSPPVNSILAAIRAVTGPPGCLLIVKNYTGDRLNFGLAAEAAKAEGLKIEMVIVEDDCALPPPRGIVGRRGLAGTVFVHKIAGAVAEEGGTLEEVKAEAEKAALNIGTMGVALSLCTWPGLKASARMRAGQIELGLGIHGEPGAMLSNMQPVEDIVSHMLETILSKSSGYLTLKGGDKVALMVNGLGGTSQLELLIAAWNASTLLEVKWGLRMERAYVGCFMTSLNMAGISLTLMKVDDCILKRLDAQTHAPGWQNPLSFSGSRPSTGNIRPLPQPPQEHEESVSRPQELTKLGTVMEAAITAAANVLIDMQQDFNKWDEVGDADCGSTLARAARGILEDLKTRYPLNDAATTIRELGRTIGIHMGGTSGALYDIFLRAAYAHLKGVPHIKPSDWVHAFEAGTEAIKKYGRAKRGDRSMLDALLPAVDTLKEHVVRGRSNPVTAFLEAAKAARFGAESTKHMDAQAGRASYVNKAVSQGQPDPGAMAVAAWLKAAATAVERTLSAM